MRMKKIGAEEMENYLESIISPTGKLHLASADKEENKQAFLTLRDEYLKRRDHKSLWNFETYFCSSNGKNSTFI